MVPILRALPVLAVVALAACEPVAPVQSPPVPPPEDACGALALQGLVGEDAGVLASMTLPAPVRSYTTGDALTMDFNPARLNIESDPGGTIVRVWCG
jgi:hypothetical protein